MAKYDHVLMDLEDEAKKALDSLKCVVSKFPTVDAKKVCMSCVERVHEAFGEMVKTRRKCVVVHRIAIWKSKLTEDTNAITEEKIKILLRTIIYHKFDIVVFQYLPESFIKSLHDALDCSWSMNWNHVSDNLKVAYIWNNTRIKEINNEVITCEDAGFIGGLIDPTGEANDGYFPFTKATYHLELKKFHTSHGILPIKIKVGQIDPRNLPAVMEDYFLFYGIKESNDIEKLLAPVNSNSYGWTTGHEAKIMSDLQINTKEIFEYSPICFNYYILNED